MKTIAVIEDDVLLNEALSRMLAGAGYQILRAHTLREGLDLIPQLPDLMIIDINLPDGEGTEACRQAREYSQIPVLILTARDEERDMIKAFDLGADDYLVKPFPMPVLLKHVEAILRRTAGEETGILYRGLKISPERKQVLRDGTEIRLSAREYALLELLARNKGKVVTKTMILEQVWDADGSFVEENTVNVTLNRLKKKIEPDPVNPVYIRNVFGLGYTFGEQDMFQNLTKSRREMEELSAALESLINGEDPALDRISEDTLPSKIQSQILRLQDKMRGSEQALAKEREEIRGLIADTAHQLRTPLANMESYLSLLKADIDRRTEGSERKEEYGDLECGDSCLEDQEYYIQAITESEEKIRFLTEGFIKMARLENGIIQIRKDSSDIQGTLLGSILQAKKAADEKKIEIRLTMEDQNEKMQRAMRWKKGADIRVFHDSQWLGEAVFNLLDNSIKYSPENSTIHISAVKNEMFLRIEVRDAGIGIEKGEENLLFRRFYRGKRAAGKKGFGLGLYLSREIVQRHGGFMKVKRLEPGLAVGIYLPEQGMETADRFSREDNNDGKL